MNTIPLMIQGPTEYCKEIVEFYKDYECVWSTWDTEPKQNIEYINSKENFTILLSEIPKLKYDYHWGLYAWVSTLNGFEYLKSKNYKFGIKIRSDFLIDIPELLKITKFDHFNCFGWDTGGVAYLCDYYFSSPVDTMCDIMKECISIESESFPENILTYVLLRKLDFRKINYTLTDDTKFWWLKRKISEQHYMDHVRNGTWYNVTNKKQISRFVNYNFDRDNFPENYELTYKWGTK